LKTRLIESINTLIFIDLYFDHSWDYRVLLVLFPTFFVNYPFENHFPYSFNNLKLNRFSNFRFDIVDR